MECNKVRNNQSGGSSISEKPGAINFTKLGIKISTNIVKLKSANTNKLNTEFANCSSKYFDLYIL